jgi:hypothetical protein
MLACQKSQQQTRQAPRAEVLIMKYGEHKDKFYSIEKQYLAQLAERLDKQYQGLSYKVGCLRSQIYLHNQISQVEDAIDQLRKIILGLNIGLLEIYPGELK